MKLELARTLVEAPPVPHKTEIIPIHASDRGTFKNCRRRWDWSSPMRNNLQPRADVMGIKPELWFGTGIHYALEKYYDPRLSRDPVEAFRYWFDLTWKGGAITDDEVKLSYDPNPQKMETGYNVRGLQDILPDSDEDEYNEFYILGVKMMEFYKLYAELNDNFSVISVEHDFSIPLGFTAIDPRDGNEKEVHVRGRTDTIIQDMESGRFGLIDHKTAGKIDEAYFDKLDQDPQCTTYMWAMEQEALIHDLPYKDIDFIIYQALRKAYPKAPTFTTRNFPSLDRTKESTTAGMFQQAVIAAGLEEWLQDNEKAQAYLEYLKEAGDEQFIVRTPVLRNKHQKINCGLQIRDEAMDMLDDPKTYPNPTSNWSCLRCAFRPPCLAKDDGSDWEGLLENNYIKNRDR